MLFPIARTYIDTRSRAVTRFEHDLIWKLKKRKREIVLERKRTDREETEQHEEGREREIKRKKIEWKKYDRKRDREAKQYENVVTRDAKKKKQHQDLREERTTKMRNSPPLKVM